MMAAPNETAMYGMVTAAYFAMFMYRYNRGHIATDNRSMVNVGVLFMLAQPLCRVIGGTNGLMIFCFLCMSSIILMPSPRDVARERREDERKKVETESSASRKPAKQRKTKRKEKPTKKED